MTLAGTIALVVKIFLLPPLGLFILYLVGWLISKRHVRAGNTIRFSAIFILFFLCTGVGSSLLGRPLEALETPLSSPAMARAAKANAIVILTAGRIARSPEYQHHDIPDYIALARLQYGAYLYRATGLPILVTGGFGQPNGYETSLAGNMKRALEQVYLIPVKWVEDKATNTDENAQYSAKILKQAGVQRVLLVTDAMHMHRARIAFEHAGLQVVAAPTMFLSESEFDIFNLFTSAENMRRSHYALYEWLGLLWYRMELSTSKT